MDTTAALRAQLAKALDWHEAHADFDRAVSGLAPELQGRRPQGLPYSPWGLLEHIRRTQRDILDFCRNPQYQERSWPDDYWPTTDAPPTATAWDESVAAVRTDRQAMQQLALDPAVDLFARIPHGNGQTWLREVLLVIDHTAYHVGELIAARRLLGAWG